MSYWAATVIWVVSFLLCVVIWDLWHEQKQR
jgi:hypothetical protein